MLSNSSLHKDSYYRLVSISNDKEKTLVLTWDGFVKEFHMKYVPPTYCDEKNGVHEF